MIRIAVSPAAFEAIAATPPLGSVGYEAQQECREPGNVLGVTNGRYNYERQEPTGSQRGGPT
jgi:hypothetical protein